VTQQLDHYSNLEDCLSRLEAGEDLETILKRYPQKAAEELRPLLVAALKARRSGAPLRVPASAQIDSRTRFLLEAGRRQSAQKSFLPRMRLVGALAALIVLLFAGVYGTSLASADAIPGETLYPVKRAVEQAQLALTANQSSRLDLEEEFDRRRILEAEQLEETGRTQSVTVAGPLELFTDLAWRVGGVKLNLTDDQIALAQSLSGSYIEVQGEIRGGEGIEVNSMELRLFTFSGLIESIQDDQWTVSGVKVLVMDTTQISGSPRIGKRVDLTTLRYEDDVYLALTMRVTGGNSKNDSSSQQNSHPQSTVGTRQGGEKLEKTPEPERSPESKEPEPTHAVESPGSSEPDDSESAGETPHPTEFHDPSKTPQPSKTPD
jgi:hypothetical protein